MKRTILLISLALVIAIGAFAQSTKVLLKTDMGDMTLMLYDDTPLHKDNFISLVNSKFFDGLLFHRVIPNFVIQTGNPLSKGAKEDQSFRDGSAPYTIPAEIRPNHIHKKGALAAARKPDQVNPRKESSGSQFYIIQGEKRTMSYLEQVSSQRPIPLTAEEKKLYNEIGGYPMLDFGYTIFGEVVEGIEVIDKIAAVETGAGDRPKKNVKVISARIIK